MRIIGDVHGKFDKYYKIAKEAKESVQIGDFGFASEWLSLHNSDLDPAKHKVLGGNHDEYPTASNVPHYLGDYGVHNCEEFSFFFIRGALSIDRHLRTTGVSWWEDEELSYNSLNQAMDTYAIEKPDVVISHTCPRTVAGRMFKPSSKHEYKSVTESALEGMFKMHQPKIWIFGHWHQGAIVKIDGTTFRCLSELEFIDCEKEL